MCGGMDYQASIFILFILCKINVGRVQISYFCFFHCYIPKDNLKISERGLALPCLYLKMFRQEQTTHKSQYRTKEERKEGEKEERKKASFSSKGSSSLAWEYNRLSSLIAAWDDDASPAKRPWRRGARSDCCIRRLVAPDKNCLRKRKRAFFPFSVPSRKLTACYILSLPDSGKCSRCYQTFSRSRLGNTAGHYLRRLYTCKCKSHVQTENIPKKIKQLVNHISK